MGTGVLGRISVGFVMTAGLLAALLALGASGAAGQTLDDEWGPVENWPMIAIHAALDRDGRVVTYGTNANGQQTGYFIYDVWTPGPSAGSGHNTLSNTTGTDLFCSLQVNRPDNGEMLLFGGDNWTGSRTTNTGNPDINAFIPESRTLRSLPGMRRSRWYASGITLPDGDVLVMGGNGGTDRAERWNPTTGSSLLGPSTNGYHWWYPRQYVMPNGSIFGFDTSGKMFTMPANLSSLSGAGDLGFPGRQNGSSAVMFEPGKILQFGGGMTRAVVIDVTGGSPVVTQTDSLSSDRHWVDATLLPDGRVLATGGSVGKNLLEGVNYRAEIWDPATGQWSLGSAAARPRLYHSTAVLLGDGRVLTAGGGAPGPVTNTNAELYRPDYLVRADDRGTGRPEILSVSSDDIVVGEDLTVTVDDGAAVDRVTMVKTGSATHSVDVDQRFLELGFSRSGNRIDVDLPSSPNVLVPGFYHLFVLDGDGVPSVSRIIQVRPPGAAHPDRDVVLHRGSNFGGNSVPVRPGVYNFTAITNLIGNDVISSLTIPPGATVRACQHSGGGGTCVTYSSSTGNLGSLNNAISYLEVTEAVTSTIGGTITDQAGNPEVGVKVDLFASDPQGRRLQFLGPAFTGVDGSYEFEVDPGCYAVTAIAPDGTTLGNGGRFQNDAGCVDPGETDTSLDFVVLRPGQGAAAVGGTITNSDGTPEPGVKVDLFTGTAQGQRTGFLRTTSTAADGTYEFEVDSAGCYVTTAVAPAGRTFVGGSGFAQQGTCVADGEEDRTLDAVLFLDSGTAIEGVVGEPDGSPVVGLKVNLFLANADGSRGAFLGPVLTDGDGRYRYDVDPGCFVLVFIAPDGRTFPSGSRFFQTGVCVDAGETEDSVNPVLS